MAMEIKVEVIHRETIRPSSPTPYHLKHFKLSLLDQLAPVMYTPLLLYYPNITNISADERLEHLRKTLSETLTHFYPLAGRIRSNLYIECNDEGAEFVEASINCPISKILENPDLEMLRQLLPVDVECKEAAPAMDVLLLVQVTFFQCGGMAIGLSISHKVTDASTLITFINTWTGTSIASGQVVLPQFGAAFLFPPSNLLSSELLPAALVEFVQGKCKTNRFVFDDKEIVALQSKVASETVPNPTRVEAVSALIWKSALEASRSNASGSSPPIPSSLCQNANIRQRVAPPLAENLVGNMVGYFAAKTQENEALELQNLVFKMRKGIEEFKESYGKGFDLEKTMEELKEYGNLIKNGEIENYNCTSWCRFPFYEADFGWGRPSWVSISGVAFKNVILLVDTKDGDGIEAWLVFREEDMALVECNKELLAFASLNPSVI